MSFLEYFEGQLFIIRHPRSCVLLLFAEGSREVPLVQPLLPSAQLFNLISCFRLANQRFGLAVFKPLQKKCLAPARRFCFCPNDPWRKNKCVRVADLRFDLCGVALLMLACADACHKLASAAPLAFRGAAESYFEAAQFGERRLKSDAVLLLFKIPDTQKALEGFRYRHELNLLRKRGKLAQGLRKMNLFVRPLREKTANGRAGAQRTVQLKIGAGPIGADAHQILRARINSY